MKRVLIILLAALLLCSCAAKLPEGSVCYENLHTKDFSYQDMTAAQKAEPFDTQTPQEGTEIYLFEGGEYLGLTFSYMQYTFTADTRTITCYLLPGDEELSDTFERACTALKGQFPRLQSSTDTEASYEDEYGGSVVVRCYDEAAGYGGEAVLLFFEFT